jgi:hypothetical protein
MQRTRVRALLSMSSVVITALFVVALAAPAGAGATSSGSGDDQQIADDSTLTIEDIDGVVGEGFTEEAPDDSEQDFDAPSCTAIRKAAKVLKKAPSTEVEFGAEAGEAFASINNNVGVLSSTKRAKSVYAAYAGSKAADCLQEAFAAAVEAQSPDAEVSVTVEEFEPDAGDASVGYEGQVSSGGGGFYFEIQFVRVGRAVDGFFFVNSASAPPSDDTVQLVEDGVSRLTENLAA